MNTQGRFQSLAWDAGWEGGGNKVGNKTHHVESLKYLTLITSAVSIERKGTMPLAAVLLGERDAGTDRDLRAHDPVPAEEGGGEEVHGPASAAGHAALSADELADDALDRAAA
jgi:hypothetical protein